MSRNITGDIDNLANIIDESHENKWVAIAADYSKVIATATTLREIMSMVSDPDAIFHRVLPRGVSFVGPSW